MFDWQLGPGLQVFCPKTTVSNPQHALLDCNQSAEVGVQMERLEHCKRIICRVTNCVLTDYQAIGRNVGS